MEGQQSQSGKDIGNQRALDEERGREREGKGEQWRGRAVTGRGVGAIKCPKAKPSGQAFPEHVGLRMGGDGRG